MEFFKHLFIFRKKKAGSDLTRLAKIVGPMLDKAANDIFMEYRDILLSEPITYIVPAVWGAAKDKNLSPEQEHINKRISPVIDELFDILQIKNLDEGQRFALGFLIRGLIISKITYMIEALKNKLVTIDLGRRDSLIRNIEPIGNA